MENANPQSILEMRKSMRIFIAVYAAVETFIFSGNIFGWSSLLHMLSREGIYDHVCHTPIPSHHLSALSVPGILVTSVVGDLKGEVMASRDFGNISGFRQRKMPDYNGCPEQDRILNLAYTIGSFCLGISSFVWGFVLDRWGLRVVRLLINAFVTSGCVLLSLTSNTTSFLLFPSLILMCLAGVPLRIANMQIANLFPEQRSTIITMYSGAFTASASVFVFLQFGYDSGFQWHWLCFLLVCLSMLMLPVTLFILPPDRIREPMGSEKMFRSPSIDEVSTVAPSVWGTYTTDVSPVFQKKSDYSTSSTKDSSTKDDPPPFKEKSESPITSSKEGSSPLENKSSSLRSSEGSSPLENKASSLRSSDGPSPLENKSSSLRSSDGSSSLEKKSSSLRSSLKGERSSNDEKSETKDVKNAKKEVKFNSKIAKSPPRKESVPVKVESEVPITMSLLSFSFAMHQYWFSWLLLYTIVYVGSLHLWVERSHGDVSHMSQVFGISQVAGIFLAPIAGIFMDWNTRKTVKETDPDLRRMQELRACFWPMMLTTLMEFAAQICKFYDLTIAIYISIAAVTLLRAFFVSIGTAYVHIRFPAYHFNKMLGIMSTTSALVTLFQFPLFIWESSTPDSVLHVNIFEAVCLAIAFVHPLLLLVTPLQDYLFRKEIAAREKFQVLAK